MQTIENHPLKSQRNVIEHTEYISSLHKEILDIKVELDTLVDQIPRAPKFWEGLGLLESQGKPKGLGWSANIELELVTRGLSDRNRELLHYLSQTKEETCDQVDLIDELVVLVEVFDANWLSELELRHEFDIKFLNLSESQFELTEQLDSISDFDKQSDAIIDARKRFNVDLAAESQSLLKHKAKLEDVYHQNEAFKAGMNLLKPNYSIPQCVLSERMRCAFNDIRRVNANLEEKLVLTGVAKQRIMRELQILLVQLRAQCSRDPHIRFRQLMDDPLFVLDDPNLAPNAIADINQVWKATMPTVPSLSGDPIHTDLVTWLSISSGYFCEEIVCDLTDILLSRNNQNRSAEADLVQVLAAETLRYKSIAGALRSVILDTQKNSSESLTTVICKACQVAKKRLGCDSVTLWDNQTGYTSDNVIVTLEEGGTPFFSQSVRETCSLVGLDFNDNLMEIPPDLHALWKNGIVKKPVIDAFSVSSPKGGITVTRNDSDNIPFPAFSGIYIEQLYRRIISAVAPLQLAEIERTSNQRPIHLVDALFELRRDASSITQFSDLVKKHLCMLFGMNFFGIFLPKSNSWFQPVDDTFAALISSIIKSGREEESDGMYGKPFLRGRNISWILLSNGKGAFDSTKPSHVSILSRYTSMMERMMTAWVSFGIEDEPFLQSFSFIDQTEEAAIRKIVS